MGRVVGRFGGWGWGKLRWEGLMDDVGGGGLGRELKAGTGDALEG